MNKNKWLLIPINLGLLMLPWIVAQLYLNNLEGDAGQAAGMGIFFWLLSITPYIVTIGLLITILTRNSVNAFKYSILGFGIPVGIALLYLLSQASNN